MRVGLSLIALALASTLLLTTLDARAVRAQTPTCSLAAPPNARLVGVADNDAIAYVDWGEVETCDTTSWSFSHYKVEYREVTTPPSEWIFTYGRLSSSWSYLEDLTPGATYEARVRAFVAYRFAPAFTTPAEAPGPWSVTGTWTRKRAGKP